MILLHNLLYYYQIAGCWRIGVYQFAQPIFRVPRNNKILGETPFKHTKNCHYSNILNFIGPHLLRMGVVENIRDLDCCNKLFCQMELYRTLQTILSTTDLLHRCYRLENETIMIPEAPLL